jgi:hypothetical protein
MKKKLQKLHVQRKIWKGHNKKNYVRHFIVWMMGRKLKLHPIKSWDVFYVMIML